MTKKFCIVCNKKLLKFGQVKFCSRECYYLSRCGVKRPEVGKKTSLSLKGHPHTKKRIDNIKQARLLGSSKKWNILTSDEIDRICKVLEGRYSSELKNIMIAAGVGKSYRALFYYIRNNKAWFDSLNVVKFNPTEVQQWPIERWESFKKDLMEFSISVIMVKYNLLEGKIINLCTRNNLPRIKSYGASNYSKVSQKLFWEVYYNLPEELQECCLFAELNTEYSHKIPEFDRNGLCIKKTRYCFDFTIFFNDTLFVLEFNGDIFHANPALYALEDRPNFLRPDLTSKDIWDSDLLRETYVFAIGGMFMSIWEKDFHQNKQECIDRVLMYINLVYYNGSNKNLRSFE
jgi:hypothetical protein